MEWRSVPDHPNYEVSDLGEVRNARTGKVLKQFPRAGGYLGLCLWKHNKGWPVATHRLVMISFVGPRPEGLEVRHLDGDINNNSLDNLAYGTRSENIRDAVAHGTHYSPGRYQVECKRGHEFTKDNTRVYNGKRVCLECRRMRDRERYARKNMQVKEGDGRDKKP